MQGLGSACQVGHIVRDLDATARHWTETLGVGPIFHLPALGSGRVWYKGCLTPISLRIALTYLGGTQIELIQPLSVGCPYSDFLDSGREGLHHMGFWVADQAATIARLKADGYDEIVRGDAAEFGGVAFSYLQAKSHGDTVFEILDASPAKMAFYERMAEAAATWDGSDPIRSPASLGTFTA